MRRIFALLILICSINGTADCQLLSKPSLSVEDFETAFEKANHLKKILKKHHFEYFTGGAIKFNAPGTITNPLMPDLQARHTENWVLRNEQDHIVIKVNIYDWRPGHGPHPEVIRTIRLMISRNSNYSNEMDEFLESIKAKYPNKSERYFGVDEQYLPYAQPMNVFSNNSKIEVRTENAAISYDPFYTVSFDLIK